MIEYDPATGVETARYGYLTNRLGSVVAVADSAGTVTDKYIYTPFGVEAPLDASGNPFRYTGRKLDPETGLYYYRARYYDPDQGRFLETDPVFYEDQMNLYAYVGNDPVNATDPTGKCAASLIDRAPGSICGGTRTDWLIDRAEVYLQTDKMRPGLRQNERKLLRETKAALPQALAMGENSEFDEFMSAVETDGIWDPKNNEAYKGIYGIQEYGNWLFGLVGAAFEHGFLGYAQGMSNHSGVGEGVLRRGAGVYQMTLQGAGFRWSSLQLLLWPWVPCPSCRYGDNPGDGQLISRGYDYYQVIK